MAGYTLLHVDELERPWPKWVLVRKSLGITSFGVNITELQPGERIPEHDERGRAQEEVFFTISGSPTIVIEGQGHPIPEGTFARLDPDQRRYVVNDGAVPARVLIVSAPTSSGYEPLDWA